MSTRPLSPYVVFPQMDVPGHPGKTQTPISLPLLTRVVAWTGAPYYSPPKDINTWTMDDATCGLFGRMVEEHIIQAGKLKVIRIDGNHCWECGDPLPHGFAFCTCTSCYSVGVLQFGQALDSRVPAAVSTRILEHVDRGVSIDYERLRTRWDKRYMEVAVVARPRP